MLDAPRSSIDLDALAELAQTELVKPCADADDDPTSLHGEALVYGLVEFLRPVHAEMAAITSAARRGIRIDGCVIYSTTFPCHECARHIVAAGLKKLFFIEPYPKSRVGVMFDDAIVVDGEDGRRVPFLPYTGVAPTMYLQLFRAPRRKSDDDGTLVDWEAVRRARSPRVATEDYGYLEAEDDRIATFRELLSARLPGRPARPGGDNA